MPAREECLLCHAPLVYLPKQEEMACALCGGLFPSNARCEQGHYVCDACHRKQGLAAIWRICLATTSKNPLAIAREIMEDPFIYMHGPEHHVLVGSGLLAACRNAGRELDLPEALSEMERRGCQVPNGICAATPNAWASAALTAPVNLPLAPIKRAFLPA